MDETSAGNWFAYSILVAWPIVALVLFRTRPYPEAMIGTVLGALLLLPSNLSIKFPMIPSIDKDSIAAVSVFFGCIVLTRMPKQPNDRFGVPELLSVVYIFSPLITSLLNTDQIIIGERILPGVGVYDGISALLRQAIVFLPFFVGRRYLNRPAHIILIFRALALAGLFYSIPMLFEIRMSPQLSNWIYGYFPEMFALEIRYGGFRPVVFMNNGLILSFFLFTSFIASVTLWKTNDRVSIFPPAGLASYLGFVLILCKSAGALIYAVTFGCLVRWTSPRSQIYMAVFLAAIAIGYPVLRMAELFSIRSAG